MASLMKSSCCSFSGVSLKMEGGLSYSVVALQTSNNNWISFNLRQEAGSQSYCQVFYNTRSVKQIILDAPVLLQVVLHRVGHTQVVSSQRAEEVFVPENRNMFRKKQS